MINFFTVLKTLFAVLTAVLINASALFLPIMASAQTIQLDELYEDWAQIDPLFDQDRSRSGLKTLKLTNDDRYLYLYMEFAEELILQDGHDYVWLIDADANAQTGRPWSSGGNTLGAELMVASGDREITAYLSNATEEVSSYDMGMVNAPTVSSREFEVVVDRRVILEDTPWLDGSNIRVGIAEGATLREETGVLSYTMSDQVYEPAPFSFDKEDASDMRVVSYNVYRDNPFDALVNPRFGRLFKALDPDIVGVQEVYDHSSAQLATLFEQWLPSTGGEAWYHSGHNAGDGDTHLVSRYPVVASDQIDKESTVYMVDIDGQLSMVISSHPPCCNNDEDRRVAFNNMMQFIDRAKNGEGPAAFHLEEGTPIIITGDMNLVRDADQQRTLLHGEYTDPSYGPDMTPDWDGSSFEDSKPANPFMPTSFTWYSPRSSFGAGRLDYIVYSGSVLTQKNAFTLHTPSFPDEAFAPGGVAEGLEKRDTQEASDHLPVVVDLAFPNATSTEELPSDRPTDITLDAHPNPFNPDMQLDVHLPDGGPVTIDVVNILGQRVKSYDLGVQSQGVFQQSISLEGYPTGFYLILLKTNQEMATLPVTMLS
ncbi:MAG: endonuclease/exonuclease/phosphatase family protein [Balneolaceae bacterium]|nr:endonuclease/exonuclease/phosphatase family protein [Balneolaceae bacterium]